MQSLPKTFHRVGLSLLALFSLASLAAAANPEPSIVPAVQQWQGGEGTFSLLNAPIVITPKDEKELRPTARIMQEDLAALGLPKPSILIGEKPAAKTSLVFTLTNTPFKAAPHTIEDQSYRIDITDGAATLTAHNRGGIYFATRSLLQMLAQSQRHSPSLPCGVIIDGPITRYRFLMLDVGRKPFPIDSLYDYLRMLGWYKMNALHLHLSDSSFDKHYGGFRVQCDTFPGLTSKDCFYTKKQLREFQDRAAAMGIMVMPELDMPGHASPFCLLWPELAWNKNPHSDHLDVNNPNVIPRMKQVLDEIIPLFDAPYFHIGTDEYHVSGGGIPKRQTAENFRKFINTMNAFVRSKGKQCVVWDGWEHQKCDVQIDPTVVVDMWWGIFDTNDYIHKGHYVINSNQYVTYLTSGRPTYGVNNAMVYEKWKPNKFGRSNPPQDDPHFLGTKLHVWFGQGPSGWTMYETADQTLPSIISFSETLWGRKGSPNYNAFLDRVKRAGDVPGLTIFNRIAPINKSDRVLDRPEEVLLSRQSAGVPLPFEKANRADLEFPWTLCMEVKKTAPNGRGVILSSDLAELCDNYTRDERKKSTNSAMKEKVSKKVTQGFGVVRASGNWGATPAQAKMAPENSRVYGPSLPLNQWVKITVIATRKQTSVYFNGKLVGRENQKMICPLRRYGSTDPTASFLGSIRNLKVYNRALSDSEIPR